jgi:hypothetical protein
MRVAGKTLGSKKALFEEFSVPLPPDWSHRDEGSDGGTTLRAVIDRIVRSEVRAFRRRQTDRQFIRALTAAEIDAAAQRGKVAMGGSDIGVQSVDEEQAVDTALIAFEDGLYLVVIDEVRYRSLDQAVFLTSDSRITFIRLTLLSGA